MSRPASRPGSLAAELEARGLRLDPGLRVKLFLTPLRRVLLRIRSDLRGGIRLSPAARWRAWWHGFTSLSYVMYELHTNDPRRYRPDFVDINYRLVAPYRLSIWDKLTFSRAMAGIGVRHPRVLGYVRRGRLLDPEGGPLELPDLLSRAARCVFRPVGGGAGQGVFFLGSTPDGIERDGRALSREEASATLARLDDHLVTEFVRQAPYAEMIYPDSPNTLRVLTLWDDEAGEPFLAAAAHRFGTSRSAPLDNFHGGHGGLSARIDPESGELGPGAELGPGNRVKRHASHPETGARIAGVRVPRWSETRARILEVAGAFPQYAMVGWDLLMTTEGAVWLEGNSPPGTWVWQVHDPLLDDPRVRAFFRSHRMI